ncbi:MAG: hypothetical protein Q9175_000044 [Cornicularia normoerica]
MSGTVVLEKSNPICIRQALRITTPDERFWQCAGKGQQICVIDSPQNGGCQEDEPCEDDEDIIVE